MALVGRARRLASLVLVDDRSSVLQCDTLASMPALRDIGLTFTPNDTSPKTLMFVPVPPLNDGYPSSSF